MFLLNWKMIRGVFKSFLLCIGLMVIIGIYNVQNCIMLKSKNLESLFLLSFGHIGMGEIFPVLFWIAPQLYLIWILRGCINSELDTVAAYIFTRTSRRANWLLSKFLFLFILNILYWLVLFAILYIIGTVAGFSFYSIHKGIQLILVQYVLIALLSYLYILIASTLSLKSNAAIGFLAAIFINISSIFISFFSYKYFEKGPALIKSLPSSQAILTWHDSISMFPNELGLFDFRLSGFNVTYSIVYLIIFCVVFIIYGCYSIEHMDIT